MTIQYLIYGSGGHARELLFQMEDEGMEVVAFVDDRDNGRVMRGLNVIPTSEAVKRYPQAQWLVGIGDPKSRERVVRELEEVGAIFASFISTSAKVAKSAKISHPVQIFANAVVSDGCVLGEHVIVHFGSILTHDVEVGDFSIICPGAMLAGYVSIGRAAWIGIGATFRHGAAGKPLIVGDGATVGAGSCVIKPVAGGTTVVGVPAAIRLDHMAFEPRLDESAANRVCA